MAAAALSPPPAMMGMPAVMPRGGSHISLDVTGDAGSLSIIAREPGAVNFEGGEDFVRIITTSEINEQCTGSVGGIGGVDATEQ
jgi:hypothetical protein